MKLLRPLVLTISCIAPSGISETRGRKRVYIRPYCKLVTCLDKQKRGFGF